MASAQEIKDAATAAATAAVTAALAGIQAQQPQVVVQKQLVMPAFDIFCLCNRMYCTLNGLELDVCLVASLSLSAAA